MRLSVTYNFYQTQKDVFFRRGDRIRTYDIQLPKLALYQAELRPVVQRSKEGWLGTESNRRHKDFQSSALPTELPSLLKGRTTPVERSART